MLATAGSAAGQGIKKYDQRRLSDGSEFQVNSSNKWCSNERSWGKLSGLIINPNDK